MPTIKIFRRINKMIQNINFPSEYFILQSSSLNFVNFKFWFYKKKKYFFKKCHFGCLFQIESWKESTPANNWFTKFPMFHFLYFLQFIIFSELLKQYDINSACSNASCLLNVSIFSSPIKIYWKNKRPITIYISKRAWYFT